MTFLIKRFAVVTAGAGMLLVSATSAAFASVEITGNGAMSHNKIAMSMDCVSSVTQMSSTVVTNSISSSSSTGSNTANMNTGGLNSIDTGDATSSVSVSVIGGENTATAPSCCGCSETVVDILVDGNGAKSKNKVEVSSAKALITEQKSKTKVSNAITSKASTGKNKSKLNTGNGVEISTGSTTSQVEVVVAGASNSL